MTLSDRRFRGFAFGISALVLVWLSVPAGAGTVFTSVATEFIGMICAGSAEQGRRLYKGARR